MYRGGYLTFEISSSLEQTEQGKNISTVDLDIEHVSTTCLFMYD